MNRRTERIGSLIRQIIGEMLLSKFSDPRVDPALTSVTSVEIAEDLLTARVYVSILDTPPRQRSAIRALKGARGFFQKRLGQQMRLRHTPTLEFELDTKLKKTLETLQLIQQATDEIRQKEQQAPSCPQAVEDAPTSPPER